MFGSCIGCIGLGRIWKFRIRIGSDFRIQSEIRSEPIRSVDNFVLLILCFLHVLDHKEQKIFFPVRKNSGLRNFFFQKKISKSRIFFQWIFFCSLWSKMWRKHKISNKKKVKKKVKNRIRSEIFFGSDRFGSDRISDPIRRSDPIRYTLLMSH